jgi:hypothetical protein
VSLKIATFVCTYYEDILDKLNIKPVINYIQNYQRKWKDHVNGMNTNRVPKLHQPRRQRPIGHPVNRWEENKRLYQNTWPNT